MNFWIKKGAWWGGIWGLLIGSTFIVMPRIGPLVFTGPQSIWIIIALECVVVVSALIAFGASFYRTWHYKQPLSEKRIRGQHPQGILECARLRRIGNSFQRIPQSPPARVHGAPPINTPTTIRWMDAGNPPACSRSRRPRRF